MTKFGIYIVISYLSLTVRVSCFRYKCFRDICDSSWQFCNTLEERCSTCTHEQCLTSVANTILNQCEQTCQKSQTTTSTVATTVTTQVNPSPLNPESPGISIDTTLLVTLLIFVVLLICGMIVGFCTINKKIKSKKNDDIEGRHSTGSLTHIVVAEGEVEKRPLLDTRPPSDSSLHDNKMADMQALAQATNQSPVQVEQASAPPSYSTDVPKDVGSPVEQPSSDPDNQLSLKLGKTDFLTDDLQTQAESVTRPKCT